MSGQRESMLQEWPQGETKLHEWPQRDRGTDNNYRLNTVPYPKPGPSYNGK